MAHILLAAHTETAAAYIQAALKKAGHRIDTVTCSLEAWRAAKTAYDVVIIDVLMPGIDSFVLAQKALQGNPAVQVVFVTGFAAVAMDMQATPSYAPAPFTSRSFHLKDINACVQRLMGLGGFGGGFFQDQAGAAKVAGQVIYTDFASKAPARSAKL